MTQRTITCPYCASQITGESTVCPGCQEDLAALAHLVYADAIHYNQALALAKEGRPREAKAELAESLAANASFGPAYALLAKICARDQDWTNARLNAKKALSLLPGDEAVVQLADAVISAAPSVVLASDAEPVDIPLNPVLLDDSRSETLDLPLNDTESANVPASLPGDPIDCDAAFTPAQPVQTVKVPVPPVQAVVKPRPNSSRRLDPRDRRVTQAVPTAGLSSVLYPPQEFTPPVVKPLVDPQFDPALDPEVQTPPESVTDQADSTPPAEESYGPLFKGSIWRTLGMGILITAGLAILIRAISGED
ncbi:MAG: hypothetical protein ACYCZF_06750 [Anaerolineae bacterium]